MIVERHSEKKQKIYIEFLDLEKRLTIPHDFIWQVCMNHVVTRNLQKPPPWKTVYADDIEY